MDHLWPLVYIYVYVNILTCIKTVLAWRSKYFLYLNIFQFILFQLCVLFRELKLENSLLDLLSNVYYNIVYIYIYIQKYYFKITLQPLPLSNLSNFIFSVHCVYTKLLFNWQILQNKTLRKWLAIIPQIIWIRW